MVSDRRAFFAKLLASGAAASALACASDAEPLIVVPQPGQVKLYSQMPPNMKSEARIDWGPSSTISTIYELPPALNQIGREVRELCHHVNVLNAAVFGGKAE